MAAPRRPLEIPGAVDMRFPPLTSKRRRMSYSLKLSDESIKSMGEEEEAFVEWQTPTSGVIYVGDSIVKFTCRYVDDRRDQTAVYSFRGTHIRHISTISGEVDIERKLTEAVSMSTKKRSLEATGPAKRELQVFDHVPAPLSSAPKRPRTRKQLDKHQRMSAPANSALRTRGASTTKGSQNGSVFSGLSPFASPQVSPGQTSNVISSRRSTPLQPPAYPPRSTPPPISSLGGHSRLASSLTPSKITKRSPAVSRTASPSHRPSAPSSPRKQVGNLRPKSADSAELRRNVIHILALGPTTQADLKNRVLDGGSSFDSQQMLLKIVREVGKYTGSAYVLIEDLWSEVTDGFSAYSDMERQNIRAALDKRKKLSSSAGSSPGRPDDVQVDLVSSSSTMEQVEKAVKQFERRKYFQKHPTPISNAAEEDEVRSYFVRLHPLYVEVNQRLIDVKITFDNLGEEYKAASHGSAKDAVRKRIVAEYDKRREAHSRFCKVLPVLHSELVDMRKRLEAWCYVSTTAS